MIGGTQPLGFFPCACAAWPTGTSTVTASKPTPSTRFKSTCLFMSACSNERHGRELLSFSTFSVFVVALVFTSSSFPISYLLFGVFFIGNEQMFWTLHS